MNPNTGTVPVFCTRQDAELTKKLYRAAPVLVNEEMGENPWGVSFLRVFDMTNDSHLFHTREELESQGFTLEGNRLIGDDEVCLPLYEAKMFWHFDHRFGTYKDVDSRSNVHLPSPSPRQYAEPVFVVQPWYWVERSAVVERLSPEGGSSLNFYIIEQLPVIPPDRYTLDLLDFIVPRVVELTYTAWDLQPFAQDILNEAGEET